MYSCAFVLLAFAFVIVAFGIGYAFFVTGSVRMFCAASAALGGFKYFLLEIGLYYIVSNVVKPFFSCLT